MQLIAYGKRYAAVPYSTTKTLAMRILTMGLFLACMGLGFQARGQTISLSLKNAPLETAFRQLEQQTIYRFIYSKEQLAPSVPVTLEIKSADLQQVLQSVFKSQPLTFSIENKYILVKSTGKQGAPASQPLYVIQGKVISENRETVSGATVSVKGTSISVTSSQGGGFSFTDLSLPATLVITGAEIEPHEHLVTTPEFSTIIVKEKINELDQVIMTAYGQTTRRLNTGSITKITGEQIAKQPVTNVLAALQGRVPGLIINQSNGYAGSAFSIQIRGQNSLLQGSEPLFIIDGVPFVPGNTAINQINSAAFQLSPFNLINTADIESVEILKDADATAIYGSRGANGAILITTKKGVAGKSKLNIRIYQGISKVTRSMPMLNTQQYLQMRREAFINDGVTPTQTNAPDIFLFDTTRYTNFKSLLIGRTSQATDAQASFSGGSANTTFMISAGYHRETTVLPTELSNNRKSIHLNLDHKPSSRRYQMILTSSFSSSKNVLPAQDLSSYMNLPPHLRLYDSTGNINWKESSATFRSLQIKNPMAVLQTIYNGEYENFISSFKFIATLFKGLEFRANLGYNQLTGNESKKEPSTSIDPAFTSSKPFAFFSSSSRKGWIMEPQLEYTTSYKQAKFSLLTGATWQESKSSAINVSATNYSNDLLLSSISGAGNVVSDNVVSQYKYTSVFGRFNVNLKNRYILNLSGRGDGSSRFGPGKQFSRFGAIGSSWIFTRERLIARLLPFLSVGKIRSSYGITGNDQIGDYQYLDTWTSDPATYQGVSSINPTRLFNPVYSWEVNRKFEVAIELGFFQNRILFIAAWYKNRSGNQLISYTLPVQTGFNGVSRNMDALIQNKGLELELTSKNIRQKNFSWNSYFNISFSSNKLLAFPGLRTSTYANTYTIGESINARYRYEYVGVNPATGLYTFTDVDRSGTLTVIDRIKLVNTDPKFYGGLLNTLAYKSVRLDVLFEFKKQTGRNYLASLGVPGYRYVNQPAIVLERWQKPGDISSIQRLTAIASSQAYQIASNNLLTSSAIFSDASYIRCKNLSLTYDLSERLAKKMRLSSLNLFIQGQNIFVITRYRGSDPENQNVVALPPLRTITGGFQLIF